MNPSDVLILRRRLGVRYKPLDQPAGNRGATRSGGSNPKGEERSQEVVPFDPKSPPPNGVKPTHSSYGKAHFRQKNWVFPVSEAYYPGYKTII
jgi:hypothetical protein